MAAALAQSRGRGDSGRHPRTSRAHAAPFRRVEDTVSGARALRSPGLRRLVPATRCGTRRPLPGPGSVPRFVHPEGSEPRPGGPGAPRGVSRVRLSRGRSAHSRAPAKGKTGAAGTSLSLPVRGSRRRPPWGARGKAAGAPWKPQHHGPSAKRGLLSVGTGKGSRAARRISRQAQACCVARSRGSCRPHPPPPGRVPVSLTPCCSLHLGQ